MADKKRKVFNWTAPWPWSYRTRRVTVGTLVEAFIFYEVDGGYTAKINGRPLRGEFPTMQRAKDAVEVEIIRRVKYTYRQLQPCKQEVQNGK